MPTFGGQVVDGQIIFIATISASQNDAASRRSFNALLDTGAQATMISDRVVQSVGLQSIGLSEIIPVSGQPFTTEKFRVRLDIPIDTLVMHPEGRQDTERTLRGKDLEVAKLPFAPQNYDVLLGMDLIQGLHLTLHGGTYILSS